MSYKLDRTAFKAQTFQEADNNVEYWKSKPYEERLKAAWYLISCAYNLPLDHPPRLDKTVFAFRKHQH